MRRALTPEQENELLELTEQHDQTARKRLCARYGVDRVTLWRAVQRARHRRELEQLQRKVGMTAA